MLYFISHFHSIARSLALMLITIYLVYLIKLEVNVCIGHSTKFGREAWKISSCTCCCWFDCSLLRGKVSNNIFYGFNIPVSSFSHGNNFWNSIAVPEFEIRLMFIDAISLLPGYSFSKTKWWIVFIFKLKYWL